MPVLVDDVSAYLLEHCDYVDPMKLQKLLYLAQSWHLAIFDEPLIEDQFEAWRDGPVINAVYQAAKPFKARKLDTWGGNSKHLPASTKAVVDAVLEQYGSLPALKLSRLTHEEGGPWDRIRDTLPPGARSRRTIPTALIADYFRQHETLLGRHAVDIAAGGSEEMELFSASSVGPSVDYARSDAAPVVGRGQFETPTRQRSRQSKIDVAALRG